MRNRWIVWIFIFGVFIVVLVALNYQGNKARVPLSDIFPEEESFPVDVEFEYVQEEDSVEVQAPAKAALPELKVEKADIPVKRSVSNKESSRKSTGSYTIQVASFKTQKRAREVLDQLMNKDFDAYIVSRDLKGKGTWYRVYVGRHETQAQAQNQLPKVQAINKSSFIIKIQ